MGRLPHPAGEGRLETKEKAPITECLICLTVAGTLASRGAGGTVLLIL